MDESLRRAMADLNAWMRLGPLLTEYLPFSATATLRPTGLTALLDEVLLGGRTVLVECGTGPSTIVLARLLARRGYGRLLSIDNDERWTTYAETQLRREGLHGVAKVVHAPLAENANGMRWYSTEVVSPAVAAYVDQYGLVDMLIVDGPPSTDPGQSMIRYPALPTLRWAMAPGATLVLDDVDRPGELTVAARWQDEYDLITRSDPSGTRLAISTLAPS
ncbi:class I SAM-dependent methyltransferase [Allokutzneria sp. NRRL B-24872]|uniref:class I SAM-dependent methyltransferase n=1 Tax=Allokutzneria sp. NRRL B-24872 TaxID=1137961 RepID=UPI000A3BFFD1|nr:class I SAM-dependent methyltransferase [Allokutzneria sp. NRRL B-24872]